MSTGRRLPRPLTPSRHSAYELAHPLREHDYPADPAADSRLASTSAL